VNQSCNKYISLISLSFIELVLEWHRLHPIECLLTGDVDTGKADLRDYINATIGFQALGTATDRSPKSLMRIFGPKGNPQARNLFEIIAHLQEREGIHLKVQTVR